MNPSPLGFTGACPPFFLSCSYLAHSPRHTNTQRPTTTTLLATAMMTTQKWCRYVVASPFFILFLTLIAPPFHLSLTHTTPRVVQTPARVQQHTQRHANTLRRREGTRQRRKRGDSLSLMTGMSPLLFTSPQGMNMQHKCGRHVPNDAGRGATPQW